MGIKVEYKERGSEREIKFTGRTDAIDAFWEEYNKLGNGEVVVLNYYGMRGIGKSRLCLELHKDLKENNQPTTKEKLKIKSFIVDFDGGKNTKWDKVRILETLANKFEKECNYELTYFRYALYKYYSALGLDKEAPEIKALEKYKLFNFAMAVFSVLPEAGEMLGTAAEAVNKMMAGKQKKKIENRKKIHDLNNLQACDIEKVLDDIFVENINQYLVKEKKPIVIFLDAYEQIQKCADITESTDRKKPDLEQFFWGEYGIIRQVPNVLWVIAGQKKLTWELKDSHWKKKEAIRYEPIGPIENLKELFKKMDITDEKLVDFIIQRTYKVTEHVAESIKTYFRLLDAGRLPAIEDFDMDYQDLLFDFIESLSVEEREKVQILACLEMWTGEDYHFLFDEKFDIKEMKLIKSYIEEKEGKYYLENSIREIAVQKSSPLVKKKCIEYLKIREKEETVTTVERNEYTLRKMQLQFMEMEEENTAEGKLLLAEAFFADNLEFIRKNIKDDFYFKTVKQMIDEHIPMESMPQVYADTLLVYKWYRCILVEDYMTVYNESEETNIGEIRQRVDDDTNALMFYSLAKCNYNTEFWSAYYNETFDFLDSLKEEYTKADIYAGWAEALLYNAKNEYAFTYSASGMYESAFQKCEKGLEILSGMQEDIQSVSYKCYLWALEVQAKLEMNQIEEAWLILSNAEKMIGEYENTESEMALVRFFKLYALAFEKMPISDDGRRYAEKALKIAQKLYELNESNHYKYYIAMGYRRVAESLPVADERKRTFFDQAIVKMKELYFSEKCRAYMNDWFLTAEAAYKAYQDVEGEDAKKYIDICMKISLLDEEYWVDAKYVYRFSKSLVFYYMGKDLKMADFVLDNICRNLEEVLKHEMTIREYQEEQVWILWLKGEIKYHMYEWEAAYAYWKKRYNQTRAFHEKLNRNYYSKMHVDSCADLGRLCFEAGSDLYLSLESDELTLENALCYSKEQEGILYDLLMQLKGNEAENEVMEMYIEVNRMLLDIYDTMGDVENSNKISEHLEHLSSYLEELNENK